MSARVAGYSYHSPEAANLFGDHYAYHRTLSQPGPIPLQHRIGSDYFACS